MKLLNILSLLIIFNYTLAAQNTATIAGKVTSGREELGFATISIDAMNLNTSSDIDGKYILKSVPEGDHIITTRFIGFEDKVINVSIKKGQQLQLDIDMVQSSVIVSEIVIIDEQTGLTAQTPYSIATISARSVELKGNPSGVMGIIRQEPGVYGAELGQGIVKPFIRGLGFSRKPPMGSRSWLGY
ncbi:MAG TPA: carboxypeptidase-like regulatory domain-containing protein [Saprospiraceae bacterium]|nr:carboxypeptidase-like regulatory domain-containing protein [Saprospiraceae bacterium]